ncbi:hypothetical protein [Alloacidobacterium sp.]|uniref:hypothetical protein n=1 Tax=Alloacidobacterium sp. TaxID=2951999 RepID=UPI002D2C922D|nr:hypothetical protein [Alloacidobacterium sp.]HYK38065.1 hypothetical protein [Alloacidobacterium sp.]
MENDRGDIRPNRSTQMQVPKGIVRFGEILWKKIEAVLTYLQYAYLYLAIPLIVVWTIPYFRARLERIKWFDENSMLDVVALTLMLVMVLLARLHREMGELSENLRQVAGAGSNLIPGGVGQVYVHLRTALESGGNRRGRSLDVLGLSLYTAWPQIYSWISDGLLHDIEITLYCMSPDFIRTQSSSISPDWGHHAQAQIDSIARFQIESAEEIRDKSITLNLSLYYCFPAIHGFRLENGEIFVAFSRWAGSTGHRHLADPNYFYERFRASDRTKRAEEYRLLFANWIDEVKHRKAVVAGKPAH